jgi:hypothetical protein
MKIFWRQRHLQSRASRYKRTRSLLRSWTGSSQNARSRPPPSPKFRRLASVRLRGARNVVPHLVRLDSNPVLAAVLAPDRPVRCVTPRVASTRYDGLRPATLFDMLGNQLEEHVLTLAPDVYA